MTEHSICHPGRPGPQGDGHEGSPGFEAFQSAKSATDRRPVLFDKVPAASISILTIHRLGMMVTFSFLQEVAVVFAPWFKFCVVMAIRFIKCRSVKVNAPFSFICKAVRDDTFHECHDLRDIFRHPS
jgi:hypothetical protein